MYLLCAASDPSIYQTRRYLLPKVVVRTLFTTINCAYNIFSCFCLERLIVFKTMKCVTIVKATRFFVAAIMFQIVSNKLKHAVFKGNK